MIQLYTGVPGSGKSYKLVHDLSGLLEKEPELTVIANINGLKLPHEDFDKMLSERFPDPSLSMSDRLERFFSYEYQESLNAEFGGPLMYVLDECQLYFPGRVSLPKTEAYLQRHRHLGHYILLATQSTRLISKNIVALVELEYRAVMRTASLFGELRYHQKSPLTNVIISTITHRPKKKVFDLYKSFDNEEIRKPKRLLLRKLWPVLLLPVAAYLFYLGVPKPPPKQAQAAVPVSVAQPQSLASPATTDLPPALDPRDIEIQRLKRHVEQLQVEEDKMVRVFLPVVKTATKTLTVDPETNAVVELKALSSRGVSCAGDICYYDKVENSIPKPYESSGSSSGYSRGFTSYAPSTIKEKSKPVPGPGSFVDADMVPAPDRLGSKKNF